VGGKGERRDRQRCENWLQAVVVRHSRNPENWPRRLFTVEWRDMITVRFEEIDTQPRRNHSNTTVTQK
jgi:hypothetical protein